MGWAAHSDMAVVRALLLAHRLCPPRAFAELWVLSILRTRFALLLTQLLTQLCCSHSCSHSALLLTQHTRYSSSLSSPLCFLLHSARAINSQL